MIFSHHLKDALPDASHLESRCHSITEQAQWTEYKDGDHFNVSRTVTWAHYPVRYWLQELQKIDKKGLRSPGSPWMFILDMVTAERVDNGLHDYSKFVVLEGALHSVMKSQVKLPENMTSLEAKDFAGSIDFTIDHRLDVPNSQDQLEFEHIIDRAILDGSGYQI